jgi:hypothetical protein
VVAGGGPVGRVDQARPEWGGDARPPPALGVSEARRQLLEGGHLPPF